MMKPVARASAASQEEERRSRNRVETKEHEEKVRV
jgi:hypothetical protein